MTALILTLPDLTSHLRQWDLRDGRDRRPMRGGDRRVHRHYLTRYFRRENLNPFGIYCLLFGAAMTDCNA